MVVKLYLSEDKEVYIIFSDVVEQTHTLSCYRATRETAEKKYHAVKEEFDRTVEKCSIEEKEIQYVISKICLTSQKHYHQLMIAHSLQKKVARQIQCTNK